MAARAKSNTSRPFAMIYFLARAARFREAIEPARRCVDLRADFAFVLRLRATECFPALLE